MLTDDHPFRAVDDAFHRGPRVPVDIVDVSLAPGMSIPPNRAATRCSGVDHDAALQFIMATTPTRQPPAAPD
jgi:hypothetical protein